MASHDTREAILDAAEELFAGQGFDKTSLREITGRARVNLAAVHYHFGSKEALISAVLERIVKPVNEERMALLDDLEARHPDGDFSLEELIAIFVMPPLRAAGDDARLSGRRMELVSHVYADKRPVTRRLLFRQFGEIFERFRDLFARVVPEVPPDEMSWRIHFVVGAMVHTMRVVADPASAERAMPTLEGSPRPEHFAAHLIPFLVAGLRAPVLSPEQSLAGFLPDVETKE